MAFPTTPILDDFNRANAGPPPSASWSSSGVSAPGSLTVFSLKLKDDTGSTGGFWGAAVGPDCENYITIATLFVDTTGIDLWVRAQQIGAATVDGYRTIIRRTDANPGFLSRFFRVDNDSGTQIGSTYNDTAGALVAGVKFGVEMIDDVLTLYVNRSGSWVSATSTSGDTTYSGAGFIGLLVTSDTPEMDDFGGGSVVVPGEYGFFRTDRVRSRRTSW